MSDPVAMAAQLRQEAEELRAWADANLPDAARLQPYVVAARLERLADRADGGLRAQVRGLLTTAATSLRRRLAGGGSDPRRP